MTVLVREKFAQVFRRELGEHGIEALLNVSWAKPRHRADDRARVSVRRGQLPTWRVQQLDTVGPEAQNAVRPRGEVDGSHRVLRRLRCGSVNAYRVKSGKPMPYRCRDCKRYFSLKTNTPMQDSKLPLRKWAWAIYLEMTSLKGVSSMKLSRDLGVRQATAWYMLRRIREAFMDVAHVFEGPVEVDETYIE